MTSLLPEHVEYLKAAGIPGEVAEAAGCYSVSSADGMPNGIAYAGPGLVFHHHPLTGAPVPQYRPDEPRGDGPKYVFPAGNVPLNLVPAMAARNSTAETVLIVEGTKQTLAAVAHAGSDVVVVGVAGCWGWSRGGLANPELEQMGIEGRSVVVAFDADVAKNLKVWEAADRLAAHLVLLGAKTVSFVAIPASGTVGLDDYLADKQNPAAVLARLVDNAGKLPRQPTRRTDGDGLQFFDRGRLRVVDLVTAIRKSRHFAVAPDGSIWRYADGVYVDDDPVVSAVRDLIGNRFQPQHVSNVKMVLADDLRRDGAVLSDTATPGLINVTNGMLRVATGELEPHDPAHLSRIQLPLAWDPTATCPLFDIWLTDRCGNQAEDLLEATGLMLCPWIGQRRVVFLFGPTRSGKSSLLRVLEALAGLHKSAVTLHQLSTNRFATASLYGALLNVAGDLSDRHIDDLSLFKQLTGDDLVSGERKFRDSFTFRNRSLFVFSANQPPTVSETSRGYLARVRPFLFPRTVEGHEDPTIDLRLAAELPGIFVQLVKGAQRWLARGGYAPGDPMVADEFAQQSDVAALFASQVVTAHPGGFTSGATMFTAYQTWADANGRGKLGRNKFLARIESTLGPRERALGDRNGPTGWRNVRVLGSERWVDADPLARFAFFPTTSLHGEVDEDEDRGAVDAKQEEVAPERANRARPDSAPVTVPADDQIELDF